MREMKDSGVEWIGEIPKNWKICRLKDYAHICNGRDYSEVLDENGDYPVIGSGGQFAKACEPLYQKESVLLGRKGTIDKPLFVDYPFWTVDTMYYTEIKENVSAKYFYYLCTQIEFDFYQYGSAVPSMTQRDLYNVNFPYPTLDEQRRIANYLDRKCSQIDTIIAQQQEVIEKLKAYKLSVITEAVTKGLNPDVPMKDSGVEWIGEIPEHWEIRRIGSFARVTSSKRIFEESYVDEGVPFYRSKEITDLSKGLHVQTEIFIPEEVFEQVNEASPAPKCGDILLTSIGTIGNTWISDGRKFYYKDGNITQIEANDSFDSAYVEYCFSSNVVLEQYTRLAMGSTLLALTIIKIKKILVAFPPLDEQRKIVQYLKLKCSSIDAAIKNKENLITKLVDYKKSLIYEVVTGKKEV